MDKPSDIKPFDPIGMYVRGQTFGDGSSTPLVQTSFSVSVELVGSFVQVSNFLTFYNEESKVLEGELFFPLPPSANVTGYALDIDGILVDAVPVPKKKAAVVFDASVRKEKKSVAVAEKKKGNVFSLKVYPMPANGDRKVKLVYVQEIDENKVFVPLNIPKTTVKKFEFQISRVDCEVTVMRNDGKNEKVSTLGDVSEIVQKNLGKVEGIVVTVPSDKNNKVYVEKHPKRGDHYFCFTVENSPRESVKKSNVGEAKIRILYDCSFSRVLNKINVEKEKEALEKILMKYSKFSCEFIPFSEKTHASTTVSSIEEFRNALSKVVYDGGTRFPSFPSTDVDFCLLVSDGFFNYGEDNEVEKIKFSYPCHVLCSSAMYNSDLLKHICNSSGGSFCDQMNPENIAKRIEDTQKNIVREVSTNPKEISEIYTGESGVNHTNVYGIMLASKSKIVLDFGHSKIEKIVDLGSKNAVVTTDSLVMKMFGKQKIEFLKRFQEKNQKEIESVGIEYGIVTKNTSLVVLKELSDFLEYKIVPPRSLKKTWKEYQNAIQKEEEGESKRIADKISKVHEKWTSRVEWYQTKFPFRDVLLEKIEKRASNVNEIANFIYETEEIHELKQRASVFNKNLDECKKLIVEKQRRKVITDFEEISNEIQKDLDKFEKIKSKLQERVQKTKKRLSEVRNIIKTYDKYGTVCSKNATAIEELKKSIQNVVSVDDIAKKSDELVKGSKIEKIEKLTDEFVNSVNEKLKPLIAQMDVIIKAERIVLQKIRENDEMIEKLARTVERGCEASNQKRFDELWKSAKTFVEKYKKQNENLRISFEDGKGFEVDEASVQTLLDELLTITVEDDNCAQVSKPRGRKTRDKSLGTPLCCEDRQSVEKMCYDQRCKVLGEVCSISMESDDDDEDCSRSSDSTQYSDCSSSGSDDEFDGVSLSLSTKPKNGKGKRRGKSSKSSDSSISVKAWTPNSQYITEIKKHQTLIKKYEEYLKQRDQFQTAPSFFLDVGDYFLSIKEKELGIRILTSILELGLDDVQLLRIVGYRLEQEKMLDQARMIFGKVLKIADHEPQSFRDLGLICEQLGQMERAIELLWKCVIGKWDSRFAQIEQTALVDLNHVFDLLSGSQKEKIQKEIAYFDARFIHSMPMDIRIIMAWDTDMTDIDLHVHDPCGEHCYYSNEKTTTGGIYTHDFTKGYGPEEFLCRVAPPGKYTIKAKYFASHQQSLTGATTILCKFFTNWARKEEKSGLVTVRLDKNKDIIDVCDLDFF